VKTFTNSFLSFSLQVSRRFVTGRPVCVFTQSQISDADLTTA
jgi:hypothetical protein